MKYILLFLMITLSVGLQTDLYAQSSSALRYIEKNELGNLNPYLNPISDATSDRFYALIFESLYRYDHDRGQYLPVLANGPIQKVDDLTIRVQLKSGVQWHDQTRFTAEDVVFTYEYQMQMGRNIQVRDYYSSKILRVSAIDNQTVEFRFTEPSDDYEGLLNLWILPSHKIKSDPTALAEFSRNPIGTGPYKFSRLRINSYTVETFENHHQQVPNIKEINMSTQRDVDSAVRQLLARITDMLIELPPDQIENIEERRTHRLEPYQSFSISTISFNFENQLLRNRNIRRAMTLGFNRQRVLEQWYANRGNVLAGPYTRGAPFYNPDLRPIPYNVSEARRLISEAGFTVQGQNGVLANSQGQSLNLKLMVKAGSGQGTDIHQNIAEDFRRAMQDIGIGIELVFMQDDDFRNSVLVDKSFDLALLEWFFDPSYSIRLIFHTNGIYNINGYSNNQIDSIFDQLSNSSVASSPEIQQQLQYRLQNLIADDLPAMFLHNVDRHAVIDNKFVNTIIDPFYFFFDIAKWQVLSIYD